MSPTLALQSPVFLIFAAAAAGVLAAAGVVLTGLTWGLRKNVQHAWAAYRSWLVIVPILLLVFFLGRETVIVFLTFIAILGFTEFSRASGLKRDSLMTSTAIVGLIAMGGATLMNDPATGAPGCLSLFMAMPVFAIAALAIVPVLRNRSQGQLQTLAFAVLGFMYFGWMFGHLAMFANSHNAYLYLGYLVLAVELHDVAAYACGKFCGRHRLCSNVSPQKTWEGAVGALGVSLLLPWALLFAGADYTPRDCLAIGLCVGLGATLGDLVMSVIKRDLGVKDMGAAIPGHGGVLDRIDSLIYVAPLVFHYVRFRHGLAPW